MEYKVLFKNDVTDVLRSVEDNVVWYFKDAEEIGSSDIAACYRSILRDFGCENEILSQSEQEMIYNAISNSLHLAQED